MLYRKLGKTGIKVSEIGFGAWQIGGGFGKQDDAEGDRVHSSRDGAWALISSTRRRFTETGTANG